MSICMIGIDHNRASVDIRALFSFTRKNAAAAMEMLKKEEGIRGIVILSTCNRMEMWASVETDWEGSLLEELCRLKEVDPTEFSMYFTERRDREAVEHLFHLTCGLKSMILAEDQIITQVKDALSLAREFFCTDNILEVLFRKAITAAKRVKTDVTFSHANGTAMDRAIEMLKEQNFTLKGKKCLVIGNGEMGKLCALSLVKQGADVTVTVRQYRSGIVSIPLGCSRINYGDRMEYLPECDLVVSATSSPNYTLKYELFESVKLEHPIYLIDLAVPRDIDPEIRKLPEIAVYDIDDFRVTGTENVQESIEQAEFILQEEMQDFFYWLDGRALIPRIQEIQQEAVEDLELRLNKIFRKLEIDESEKDTLRKNIDTAAGKVISKMIYGLRETLSKEEFLKCVKGLEHIYEE